MTAQKWLRGDGVTFDLVFEESGAVASPPVADPILTSLSGLVAQFDGSHSVGVDSRIVAWSWQFGDGSTSSVTNPAHTYATEADFLASLTVTDAAGRSDTREVDVPIVVSVNRVPVAAFTTSVTGGTASVDASASADPDGFITRYDWLFGDGSSGTGQKLDHAYAVAGTYTIVLTVTDNVGAATQIAHDVTVAPVGPPPGNQGPTAAFQVSNVSGLQVSLNASASTDADGAVVEYDWNFGDGTTGSGVSTVHTYIQGGVYTISLTVVDNAGAVSTPASQQVTVQSTVAYVPFTIADLNKTGTKPTKANTGAGLLRAVTQTIDVNTSSTAVAWAGGTMAGGVLTVTVANYKLVDTYIKGRVKVAGSATNAVVENNIIELAGSSLGDAVSKPNVTFFMVDTAGASASARPTIRFNTIRNLTQTPILNGWGTRNAIFEYNQMTGVVDGFTPNVTSASNDVNTDIRGNWVGEHIFYAGAGSGHSAGSLTQAGSGIVVVGPAFCLNVGWTHCDSIQVEPDLTTGLRLHGNTFVATWSTDSRVSMLPLPYDSNNRTVIKEMSCFMLNGGRSLAFNANWLDGGEECVNNSDVNVTGTIYQNKFGRGMAKSSTADSGYLALMMAAANLLTGNGSSNQNVWEDTGNVVPRKVN